MSKVGGVGFDKKYIDLQTQEQVFLYNKKSQIKQHLIERELRESKKKLPVKIIAGATEIRWRIECLFSP